MLDKSEISPDHMNQNKESNPFRPYEGDLSTNEKMRLAYEQYQNSLAAVKEGTFPVKKGSFVFRIIDGMQVGRSSARVKVGEMIENNYATPHVKSIEAFLVRNDLAQSYYDGSPYDMYQKVAIIEVNEFEIPKPDNSHDLVEDRDQVIVKGVVKEILTPQDFLDKYKKEKSV